MTNNQLKTAFQVLIAAVILTFVFLGLKQYAKARPQSLKSLVRELGSPNILAKSVEIVKQRVKCLHVLVPPLDPKSVSNWTVVTNCIVVWVYTEVGQRNVRYFYDEMKSDPEFDGGGWYSARNIFGEKLTVAHVDSEGMITNQESFKIDAISFKLDGFVPRKRNEPFLEEPTQKH